MASWKTGLSLSYQPRGPADEPGEGAPRQTVQTDRFSVKPK